MAKTFWADTLFNLDITSGGQGRVTLITDFSSEELRLAQITLMRTIVGLDCAYTIHDNGEGSQRCDIGIAIASQESFAAGSVPDPSNAADHPIRGWIFRTSGRVFGFAADQPAVYSWRIDKDIRSRRKLENGEAYLVADNTALEGTASTVRLVGLVRQLWLVR